MVDIPEPIPNHNQVKIKVKHIGLNYAEIMARNGLYQDCPELPCVLGYETVGTVIQSNEDKSLIGKRVLALSTFKIGIP